MPSAADVARLVPADTKADLWYAPMPGGGKALAGLLGRARVICSIDRALGREWFHVSVSVRGDDGKPSLPTWAELLDVRAALFKPDVVVVQVFPPADEWYSIADVLHMWQRIGGDRLVPDLRRGGQL